MARLKWISVALALGILAWTSLSFRIPSTPPKQLPNKLKKQISLDPSKELSLYLKAFEKIYRSSEKVTSAAIGRIEQRAADHNAKVYRCGHHYDMHMNGPGCPLSSWDLGARKIRIKYLNESRTNHLMSFDQDGDGILYRHEITNTFQANTDAKISDVCAMPQPSQNAQIVFLDTFFAAGRTKVHLKDWSVSVLNLEVEKGSQPIYLVASSAYHPMIFDVTGDVSRIENFVAHGTYHKERNTSPIVQYTMVGVSGLPKDKVTLIDTQCLKTYKQSERHAVHDLNEAMLSHLFKRPVDHSLSYQSEMSISIPSGKTREKRSYKKLFEEIQTNLKAEDIISNAPFADKPYYPEFRELYEMTVSGAIEEVTKDQYLVLKPIKKFPRLPDYDDRVVSFRIPSSIEVPPTSKHYYKVVEHDTYKRIYRN